MFIDDFAQAEDWQSDKCEVPVMEGVPVSFITERLQNVVNFIGMSSKSVPVDFPLSYHHADVHIPVPEVWRQPLHARILLRKVTTRVMKWNER